MACAVKEQEEWLEKENNFSGGEEKKARKSRIFFRKKRSRWRTDRHCEDRGLADLGDIDVVVVIVIVLSSTNPPFAVRVGLVFVVAIASFVAFTS